MCGHVFHTDCIHKFIEPIRKPKAECCPFKCHHIMFAQVPAQDDTQMMNDDQPDDTNVDDVDGQQAVSEDEEGLMAAVLR